MSLEEEKTAVFGSADEVYRCIGGAYRAAIEHPEIGPQLAAMNLDMQVVINQPRAHLLLRLRDPIEVVEHEEDQAADVRLVMPAETADRYWRGEYNLPQGIATGDIKAKGPVHWILKVSALTKAVRPVYLELVSQPDEPAAEQPEPAPERAEHNAAPAG